MTGLNIPQFKEVLLNIEKDGYIEIENSNFGFYQILCLDNENYYAYISQHGIKIKDKKNNNNTLYQDVFLFDVPNYFNYFIKEEPKFFSIEFLDKFDRFDRVKKFMEIMNFMNKSSIPI